MRVKTHLIPLLVLCLLLTTTSAIAQDGRIVRETVYSPSLEGNLLGDSPNRQVTIYLPPSYDDGDNLAYPVVYLLHGYTGNHDLWNGGGYSSGKISGNILDSMKSWLKEGKVEEMILVMPDSHNKLQGSMYTNSSTTGNWADFIAKDLVQNIDGKYRTLPQRESRAVIGHSMGGYGGMKLGLLYPDVFGGMGGMAGLYDLEVHINGSSGSYADGSGISDWDQFYSSDNVQMHIAIAAAFAPNPNRPPVYCDFPFIYTDANPRRVVKNQEVYDKFLEHDILRMAEGRVDVLLSMRAIYVDCGTGDGLIRHARMLHDKLDEHGVEHVYKEFAGTHTSHVMNSTGDALEAFSSAMAFEMLVSVEPAGKLGTTCGHIRRAQ